MKSWVPKSMSSTPVMRTALSLTMVTIESAWDVAPSVPSAAVATPETEAAATVASSASLKFFTKGNLLGLRMVSRRDRADEWVPLMAALPRAAMS